MLLLTFSSAFFLSASAPSTAPSSEFTGNTVQVIGILLSIALSVVGIWKACSRQPPVAEEMHEKFVRREEWDQSGQRLHERIDATQEKIDDLSVRTSKGFQDMEGAIGRVGGQLKELGRKMRIHDEG